MSKNIIFYGAGQNARIKAALWAKEGLVPACFADEDSWKWHTSFELCGKNIEILPLSEAVEAYPDYELYLTQASANLASVLRYLLDEGIPFKRIRFCEAVKISDLVSPYFLKKECEAAWGSELCPLPFFHPHIVAADSADGSWGDLFVYPCAPPDNSNPIGSLHDKTSFNTVWNSGYGKIIKNKVKNRDYSDCSPITCASAGRYLEAISFMKREKAKTGKMPLVIKFMHDYECNLHCIMCRDFVRTHTKEYLKTLNDQIENVFLPMCKDADAVYFAGNGDPFASRHYRKLISAIASRYPHMKFLLHTNGILCNEANCAKLGILNQIDSVLISVNAAKKETYEKIMIGAKRERLEENIEWINRRIENGSINALHFSFVVQKENYTEMAEFVEFARKHRASCRFTLCHPEPCSTLSKCSDNEIFNPNHPEFFNYCEVLKNPVFDWEGCFLDPYSKYLRQYCL